MSNPIIAVNLVLTVIAIGLLVALLVRSRASAGGDGESLTLLLERTEGRLRDELSRLREAQDQRADRLREGLAAQGSATAAQLGEALRSFGSQFVESHRMVAEEQQRHIEQFRANLEASLTQVREETRLKLDEISQMADSLREGLAAQGSATAAQLGEALRSFGSQFGESHRMVAEEQQRHIEQFRANLEASLNQVREETRLKLDEIRQMVEQRLQHTLETRLGESFRTVSEQLKVVHQGLGEMQALASGVGDLKRVLSGVKVRGLWGEAQLKALLDQMLAPGQYEENVAPRPGSGERVEFAVRLPGPDRDTTVWLPIDAKFPLEDYERLVHAFDANDPDGIEEARKALRARIRGCAKDIHDRYLEPPYTTSVAILYLPIEGLYAEVVQDPGLVSALQQDYQVLVAGPTTLAALLTALQMGFRTLAIERRSREIWHVLSAIKTEFAKFGEALDKVGRKLQEAQNTIESSQTRKRAMERKLKEVEMLPEGEAAATLGIEDGMDGDGSQERS